MPTFTTLPTDPLTGAVGRRASGAPLYHRGSVFGPPERRKLDRNLVAKIMFLAEALDRRTRGPRQHGGLLKAKGLDVLRALLRRFYSYATGECFPSYDAIAEAADCCIETVRQAIRRLETAGIIRTIRRKVVASFVSRVNRVRFDAAVQASNSYTFSMPSADPPAAMPQKQPAKKADTRFRHETSQQLRIKDETDLAAAKARWVAVLLGTATTG